LFFLTNDGGCAAMLLAATAKLLKRLLLTIGIIIKQRSNGWK
jgi:hypothetical protein